MMIKPVEQQRMKRKKQILDYFMLRIISIVLMLFCVSTNIFSQNRFDFAKDNYNFESDSLLAAYEGGNYYYQSEDSTIEYLQYITRSVIIAGDYRIAKDILDEELLSRETENMKLSLNTYTIQARLAYLMDEFDESERLFNKLIRMIPENYDSVSASVYLNASLNYWENGDFNKFELFTLKALEYAEKASDIRRKQISLLNLAEFHELITRDYDKAIDFAIDAAKIVEKDTKPEILTRIKMRKAVQLAEIGKDFEGAKDLIEEAVLEASLINYSSLENQAKEARLRINYLYSQAQLEKKIRIKKIIQGICGVFLLLIVIYFIQWLNTPKSVEDIESRIEEI